MSETTETTEQPNEPRKEAELQNVDAKEPDVKEQVVSNQLKDQEIIEENKDILHEKRCDEKGENEIQNKPSENQEPVEGNAQKDKEESCDGMQLRLENLTARAIEDEEMPSMVANPSPTKVNESHINEKLEESKHNISTVKNNIQQAPPRPQVDDDDDSDCVCIDDDDDDDEKDASSARSSMSYEGSSSYDEEEEMHERGGREHEMRRIRNDRVMDDDEDDMDEEVEEEEDYEDEGDEEEEGEMITDSDPDCFDGGSDDCVVRFNNGIKRRKERSASLQDLNLISPRKINPFRQNLQDKRMAYIDRRMPVKKYSHIQSKVKKYIDDMTEQRKMSMEKRRKNQDEVRFKNQQYLENPIRKGEKEAARNVREYTDKGLPIVEEYEETNVKIYNLSQTVENGDISMFNKQTLENRQKENEEEIAAKTLYVECQADSRPNMMNGAAQNQENYTTIEEKGFINVEEQYSPKPILNGEDPLNTDCDMRTLSYNEYMKGSNNIKQINEHVIQEDMESEKGNVDSEDRPYNIRIECVTSSEIVVDDEPHNPVPIQMLNKSTVTDYQEDPQVANLTVSLNKRNMAFDHLRDAYQKMILEFTEVKQENIKMREQMNILQHQLQSQQKKPETEDKSTQVNIPITNNAPNMPVLDIEEVSELQKQHQSAASGVSSAWSESSASGVISMEPPPNVSNAFNSDDSMVTQNKTNKNKDEFSKGFLTSSKILQTLSNISSHVNNKTKNGKRLSDISAYEEPSFVEPAPPSARKRKANDTMELSSTAQPFKVPHTAKSDFDKSITNIGSDPKIMDLNTDTDSTFGMRSDGELELPEMEDEVKVFIYPEGDDNQRFLIQAKEIGYKPRQGVRECGPYLLGNVEVYMREMNGTINIWGKEVSPQQVEDLEISSRSKEERPLGFRWQSTPRVCDNNSSNSAGRKSRTLTRFSQKGHTQECSVRQGSCQSCNQSIHDHNCNHGFCTSAIRMEDTHCGCSHKMSSSCCQQTFVDPRRHSMPNSCHDIHCGSTHYNPCQSHHHHQQQQRLHPQQNFVRRHSFQDSDDNEDDDMMDQETVQKLIHSNKDDMSVPSSSRKASVESSAFQVDDFVHLQKPSQEEMETQESKRKQSGRKVKGLLMDLIKGCGDFRTTNPSNKTSLGRNPSIYEPASTSDKQNMGSNDRNSNNKVRIEQTTEIKTQLEFFQQEMEKLQAKSKSLHDMLKTIYNEDGAPYK